jgi:large subunit ribosomal protein L31e
MADIERIYVVPLRSAYESPRTGRSRKAVKMLRGFISRHMKANAENVSISEGVNRAVWKRGIQKPPRKIKVRVVKKGESVSVMLLEEKEGGAKKEKKAREKKEGKAAGKKAEEPKKEEKKEAPARKEEAAEKPAEAPKKE